MQRHVRGVLAHGQRQGTALFRALATAADRVEMRRATAFALARLRLAHRLAKPDGRVFSGMMRRLDAAAEQAAAREDMQSATRRVIDRTRSRHVLTGHARRGGRAMIQVFRRLTGEAAREARATGAAISRLRSIQARLRRKRRAVIAYWIGLAADGGGTASNEPATGGAQPKRGEHSNARQCRAGHALSAVRARIGQADLQALTCDLCLAPIGPRQDRWSCTACDWDVCGSCRGSGGEQWSAQRVAEDVAALARATRERARARARQRREAELFAADRARRDARERDRAARACTGASGGAQQRKRVREDGEAGRPPRVKGTTAAAGSRENV